MNIIRCKLYNRLSILLCFIGTAMLYFASGETLQAENVYLRNGESLKGSIVKVEPDFLYLESDLGYGLLKIPREEVILVTFPNSNRIDLARRYGIGYYNRSIAGSQNDRYNYQTNQFSLRTYFSPNLFLDYLMGYKSYQYTDSQTQNKDTLTVFQANVRGAYPFYRLDNAVIYAGVGVGVVNVEDTLNNINESGFELSVFVGTELFFQALPDFGFSGEISLQNQTTESLSRNEIGIISLPTVSVHYYF